MFLKSLKRNALVACACTGYIYFGLAPFNLKCSSSEPEWVVGKRQDALKAHQPLVTTAERSEVRKQLLRANANECRFPLWQILVTARDENSKPALIQENFIDTLMHIIIKREASTCLDAENEESAMEALADMTKSRHEVVSEALRNYFNDEDHAKHILCLASIAKDHEQESVRGLALATLEHLAEAEVAGVEQEEVLQSAIQALGSDCLTHVQPAIGIVAQLARYYRTRGLCLGKSKNAANAILAPIASATMHGVGAPRFILSFLHRDNSAKQPLIPEYMIKATVALMACVHFHEFSANDILAAHVLDSFANLLNAEDNPDAQKYAVAGVRGVAKLSQSPQDKVAKSFAELKLDENVHHLLLHSKNIWTRRSAAQTLATMVSPPHAHLATQRLSKRQLRSAFSRTGKSDWFANKWCKQALKEL